MKRLVITADDFGAAVEVNEAIEEAHRNGILTATSLMVGAPFAEDAVRRAKTMPDLRVGLHLVLTEGRPVLPVSKVPHLVDASGAFPANMAMAAATMFFNARARTELHAEIEAQFEAFRATGLNLDHANAHKHFHLFPTIGAMMVEIGKRYGLRALRVPYEPLTILKKAAPGERFVRPWVTVPLSSLLRRKAVAAGMTSADAMFGIAFTGAMTAERLCGLIRHAPPGLTEIYLHPATGDYAGFAPGYRYREELKALLSPDAKDAVRESFATLGGFADFV